MARPRLHDDKAIIAALREHRMVTRAARSLGITRDAIYRRARVSDAVREEIARLR